MNGDNDGKYPKTTEEFMKKVVEPNMIELPELEPNQEYFFDPEQHELVILERIDEPRRRGIRPGKTGGRSDASGRQLSEFGG